MNITKPHQMHDIENNIFSPVLTVSCVRVKISFPVLLGLSSAPGRMDSGPASFFSHYFSKGVGRSMDGLPILNGPADHMRVGFNSFETEFNAKHPVEAMQNRVSFWATVTPARRRQ